MRLHSTCIRDEIGDICWNKPASVSFIIWDSIKNLCFVIVDQEQLQLGNFTIICVRSLPLYTILDKFKGYTLVIGFVDKCGGVIGTEGSSTWLVSIDLRILTCSVFVVWDSRFTISSSKGTPFLDVVLISTNSKLVHVFHCCCKLLYIKGSTWETV